MSFFYCCLKECEIQYSVMQRALHAIRARGATITAWRGSKLDVTLHPKPSETLDGKLQRHQIVSLECKHEKGKSFDARLVERSMKIALQSSDVSQQIEKVGSEAQGSSRDNVTFRDVVLVRMDNEVWAPKAL